MKEKEGRPEIILLRVEQEDGVEDIGYCPTGGGDFDKFCIEQKKLLEKSLKELRINPPRRTKHDGRFKSGTQMNNAYSGRDDAIENTMRKLAFLQTGGEHDEVMRLRINDEGMMSGFEIVRIKFY